MSDSEPTLPGAPGGGTPPPPPPPPPPGGPSDPPIDPNPPTEPLPTVPGAPGTEPTTQMPATDGPVDPDGLGPGAGTPPTDPPDAPVDPDENPEEPVPWYKKPGPLALAIIVALAIIGLVGWLIFGGGDDDDDATATSSRLILEATDSVGDPLDTGFIVEVAGPADAATSFVWLRPADGPRGEPAGDSTGSDGRVDFVWEADDTVADPTAWVSTADVVVNVPPGWIPPAPVVDCVLQPFEGQQSVVSMSVEVSSPDTTIDRFASLTFPNYQFTPGDSVTCKLVATAPAPTTVVETTVVETTVVETTVVETTVPETTVVETTVAPTTVAPTTSVAPVPATLRDAISADPTLSDFLALADTAGLGPVLDDPNAAITLFIPNNDAIAAANIPADITEAELLDVLLAHVDSTQVLDAAAVLSLPAVPVDSGGDQTVDAAATPPTIGGAGIIAVDQRGAQSIFHVIDAVMPIPTP